MTEWVVAPNLGHVAPSPTPALRATSPIKDEEDFGLPYSARSAAASFVTVFQFRAVPSFGSFSFDGP
jgi:hypothetical protein